MPLLQIGSNLPGVYDKDAPFHPIYLLYQL